MSRTPEGKVKDKVSKILKKHDVYKFMPVQSRFGTHTLDFLVCHRSLFLGIETKAKRTQTYSPRQDLCRQEIEAAGGVVMLINDEASLAALDDWLKRVGKSSVIKKLLKTISKKFEPAPVPQYLTGKNRKADK